MNETQKKNGKQHVERSNFLTKKKNCRRQLPKQRNLPFTIPSSRSSHKPALMKSKHTELEEENETTKY